MYPQQVYSKKCSVCSNDEEGNRLWAFGESCLASCPPGFFADEYDCKKCRWGCAECSEEDTCDTCARGYTLTETGECVNECPRENYYKDSEGDYCLKCPEGCTRCKYDDILQRPYCFDCSEDFKLTPDHQCVDECQKAGFVDQLGQDGIHYCQHECDYKWGRNKGLGEKDVCFRCESEHCDTCEFRERKGFGVNYEICLDCEEDYYLRQDADSIPSSICLSYFECNGDLSPIRVVRDGVEYWECTECMGYWDHSVLDDEDRPTCQDCRNDFGYCSWCAWDFDWGSYQCIECQEGAIYDPISRDCVSECGRLKPFSLHTKSGPFLVEQDTCVDFCPVGWIHHPTHWECLESDQPFCETATLGSGEFAPICTSCQTNHTTSTTGSCVDECAFDEKYVAGTGCVPCAANEYKDTDGNCELCSDAVVGCNSC